MPTTQGRSQEPFSSSLDVVQTLENAPSNVRSFDGPGEQNRAPSTSLELPPMPVVYSKVLAVLHLEFGPCGDHAPLEESPQIDQQLARQSHDPDLAGSWPAATEACLVPLAESARRLIP